MKKTILFLAMAMALVSILSWSNLQNAYAAGKTISSTVKLSDVVEAAKQSDVSAMAESFYIIGYSWPALFDPSTNYYEIDNNSFGAPQATSVPSSTAYVITYETARAGVYGVTMDNGNAAKVHAQYPVLNSANIVVAWYTIYQVDNVSNGNHMFEVTGSWNSTSDGVDRDRWCKFDRMTLNVQH